jgi:hypothetical protein
MLWATLAPFIKTTITGLALDVADPLWTGAKFRDQKRPFISPTLGAEIVIRIAQSRVVAGDERATFTPGSPGSLSIAMHGIREFTVNVQAKSHKLEYAGWCHEYLERIRTRIMRRSVRDAMLVQNLICYEAGPIIELEGKEDGAALSVGSLDLFMRAGFVDTAETGQNWIETIELTSHVSDEGGTEYEQPAGNFTNEIMPAP